MGYQSIKTKITAMFANLSTGSVKAVDHKAILEEVQENIFASMVQRTSLSAEWHSADANSFRTVAVNVWAGPGNPLSATTAKVKFLKLFVPNWDEISSYSPQVTLERYRPKRKKKKQGGIGYVQHPAGYKRLVATNSGGRTIWHNLTSTGQWVDFELEKLFKNRFPFVKLDKRNSSTDSGVIYCQIVLRVKKGSTYYYSKIPMKIKITGTYTSNVAGTYLAIISYSYGD